jgi:hypothetical protein
LNAIVGANDEKLMNSAALIFRMVKAHWMLQMQHIFIEPLVDPAQWLKEYAKESGPSPYAFWVTEVLPPDATLAYPTTNTPLLGEISFGIMNFLGYPDRFVEMSQKLSFLYENYPAIVIKYLGFIGGGRDMLELPRAIMKREVEWNMIEQKNGIRDSMEEAALILIDTLKLLVERYVPAEDVFRSTVSNFKNCLRALESYLSGLNENFYLRLIHRIRSESDQVRNLVLTKVNPDVRLCDL